MTDGKGIVLEIKRPKRRNLPIATASAVLCVPAVILCVFIAGIKPEETGMKILFSFLYALSLLFAFLAAAFSVNALRNLFAPPTVRLSETELEIVGGKKIKIGEIETMKVVPAGIGSHFEKLLLSTASEEISVPQSMINFPVETLLYALNLRRKAIKEGKTD